MTEQKPKLGRIYLTGLGIYLKSRLLDLVSGVRRRLLAGPRWLWHRKRRLVLLALGLGLLSLLLVGAYRVSPAWQARMARLVTKVSGSGRAPSEPHTATVVVATEVVKEVSPVLNGAR